MQPAVPEKSFLSNILISFRNDDFLNLFLFKEVVTNLDYRLPSASILKNHGMTGITGKATY